MCTSSINKIVVFILLICLGSFFACNNRGREKDENNEDIIGDFDCTLLTNRDYVLDEALYMIDQHNNPNIWNLSDVDTEKYLTVEGYFTNTTSKSRLVVLGGEAGGSAGTACNMLMIFECADTPRVVWAGQVGDITEQDIKDLNGDGILDIVCRTSSTWMGECNSSFDIFNFKNSKKNTLYKASSRSVIGCGSDNWPNTAKIGDTLSASNDCRLIKDKAADTWQIQESSEYQIHNGGTNAKDILSRLKVVKNIAVVPLSVKPS